MSKKVFLPGSTIGIMGSGQLGRMFAIAARKLGYRIHIFSPEQDTPAGQIADVEVSASYYDEEAVVRFARSIDVLTFEFENIPSRSSDWAALHCEVRPAGNVLHICQNRRREKESLSKNGFPLPPFAAVQNLAEFTAAVERIGTPSVLKSADFGYDGKGQVKLSPGIDLAATWESFAEHGAVLEGWVPFVAELSVIVARNVSGEVSTFPVARNVHTNHILDVTSVPFGDRGVEERATQLGIEIATALDVVGLIAVELFLLEDGTLLVNELAPRTHNSGHYSFDACVTSQFEQHVRAVCGLPLGAPDLLRPAAMANLLGDVWEGGEPNWAAALRDPSIKLHLYGKAQARPGRKMGHLVAMGHSIDEAVATVRNARTVLTQR